MKFIDNEGKERNGENFKMVEHENGNFIECNIIGNDRTWNNFYPLQEFTENNPRMFDGLGKLIVEN